MDFNGILTCLQVFYTHRLYKNLFLRKKSSWPRAALDLAAVEKGEVIPESAPSKTHFLFLSNYYWTLSTNSGTRTKGTKTMLFLEPIRPKRDYKMVNESS